MRRWFPILALVATTLWVAEMAALVADTSGRIVKIRFDWAVLATLTVHVVGCLWFRVNQPRLAVDSVPGWVLVQAAKHRRKGVYFAVWGLVILGLGWVVAQLDAPPRAYPGQAFWFSVAWNFGFQPVLFVAESLGISAQSKLNQWFLSQKSAEIREF